MCLPCRCPSLWMLSYREQCIDTFRTENHTNKNSIPLSATTDPPLHPCGESISIVLPRYCRSLHLLMISWFKSHQSRGFPSSSSSSPFRFVIVSQYDPSLVLLNLWVHMSVLVWDVSWCSWDSAVVMWLCSVFTSRRTNDQATLSAWWMSFISWVRAKSDGEEMPSDTARSLVRIKRSSLLCLTR